MSFKKSEFPLRDRSQMNAKEKTTSGTSRKAAMALKVPGRNSFSKGSIGFIHTLGLK